SICSGNSTSLTGIYNTAGLTAGWTAGSVTVADPSAVSAQGAYLLIASNAAGCTDSAIVTLTVSNKPALGRDTAISICLGASADLTAVFNTTGATPDWTINGNAVSDPTAVNVAGIYQLIATNNFSCADTAILTLTVSPKPVIGNDTTINICQGDAADLTTVFNTTGVTTNWTINGNAVSNPAAVQASGVYSLIVTSPAGCKDTILVTITFNPKPALGNDTATSICQGNSFDLNNVYNIPGLSTDWSINGTAVSNPSALNTAGQYQLIAGNGFGCTDTALVTLTVNARPRLGNDLSTSICAGNTLNLVTLYNTGNNSNNWTRDGAVVSNPASVNTAGVYQLITITSAGCADTVLLTLTINDNPTVVITNPAPVCAPQTVNLTDAALTAGSTAGLGFTYWTDAAATNAYSNAGAATGGTWYIKGTNATGCFDTRPVTVTYYPLPVVSAGDDLAICDKDSATLNATVTNITAPVTYQWEPVAAGGIVNPTAAGTVVKPAATQQYILTVKDSYGCDFTVRDTIVVTVQPPVKAFAGNDTLASAGIPHQLNATGGVNYNWSPGSLLNNPFIANPMATINQDSVMFIVTVRDIAGCVGYDTVWVKVFDAITYYVPNAFSPNGDGRNDFFKPIAAGILSTESFRIFNRYGEIVFDTNQWNKGWDGTYKGKPQGVGNYVWFIKGKGKDGKLIEMRGNVVLVR
ncbi:MAG: gliding motility-associated C-terminal domain-containing protein, partial [Ferruginibacter sp.]